MEMQKNKSEITDGKRSTNSSGPVTDENLMCQEKHLYRKLFLSFLRIGAFTSVSYTHLTLPTILRV